MFKHKIGLIGLAVLLLMSLGLIGYVHATDQPTTATSASVKFTHKKVNPTPAASRWQRHTDEHHAYPHYTPSDAQNLKLVVSLAQQTVQVYDQNKLVLKMIASTGITGSDTPSGTFVTSSYKAENFFNVSDNSMGGNYATGIEVPGYGGQLYLFHSVPTATNGDGTQVGGTQFAQPSPDYIDSEGAKLGHKASHGCIRLSVPDAKWVFDNVYSGAQVVIE